MQTPRAIFDDRNLAAVVLIGARGSGKTTVGRVLADEIEVDFIDLDERALALSGEPSVRDVFEHRGESAWRQAEAAAFASALDGPPSVIATGGGMACIDPPRAVLRAAASKDTIEIIWLRCDGQTLKARLETDPGDRPSLTGQDPIEEAIEVAASRAQAYESIATHIIDATGPPAATAAAIMEWIRR
ncbi:MAG: shikimate kinase [Phycisphaerales bacterium]|jgi:shikimate kinase|nr:shikimate kinase [Phycisphaerales bacterium]MDP6891396.1 shikimate kinase [Phycisphaerales bacterium]